MQSVIIRSNGFAYWMLLGLAITLQLLLSQNIEGNEIRVAAADLLLPIVLAGMAAAHHRGERVGIRLGGARMWLWLGALTAWLAFALLRGVLYTGTIQAWALINKFLGWFVLVGFLVAGAWLGRRASHSGTRLFVVVFLLTAVAIGLADYWPYVQTMRGHGLYVRMSGIAGNPNAYGYLVSVVVIVGLAFMRREPVFGPRLDWLCVGFLVSLVVLSGSRSAWLSLLLGLCVLLGVGRVRWRLLFAGGAVAAAFVVSANSVYQVENAVRHVSRHETDAAPPMIHSYISREDMLTHDSGISHRLAITRDALELWKRHPVEGVGLGGFVWKGLQEGKTSTIHNTALWLLTETGAVGVMLFAGFFLWCIKVLWRRRQTDPDDTMAIVGLATLAVFLGASIGMEAMYQRHVWFLLGWALAEPAQAGGGRAGTDVP